MAGGGGGRGADDGNVTLNQTCVDNLKLLAQADLALDTANPSMNLMTANVKLADAIPNLRIIMDHLPSFDPTPDNRQAYEAVVKEMAARPNIFVKLTEVYHPLRDGTVPKDYEPLRARLEYLYGMFGEDRVMFGTDYPNSYGVATIPEEVGLVKKFFATKTRAQARRNISGKTPPKSTSGSGATTPSPDPPKPDNVSARPPALSDALRQVAFSLSETRFWACVDRADGADRVRPTKRPRKSARSPIRRAGQVGVL